MLVYFSYDNSCSFSLPLGIRDWLRLVIVALPGPSYYLVWTRLQSQRTSKCKNNNTISVYRETFRVATRHNILFHLFQNLSTIIIFVIRYLYLCSPFPGSP